MSEFQNVSCTCSHGYTCRNMQDPNCCAHNCDYNELIDELNAIKAERDVLLAQVASQHVLLKCWQTWLGASRESCDDSGMKLWDKIDETCNAKAEHHLAARDAEVAAKAIEDFCKSPDGLAIDKCPQESDGCSDDLITGWKAGNVDCRMAGFKYVAKLRAKVNQ